MSRMWWCPGCGVVWTAPDAPICQHMVVDGPRAERMVPLPSWHPWHPNREASS